MKYAQIKDGIVKNIIELEDASLEAKFAEGFDALKRIDNIEEAPAINHSYDAQSDTYTAPEREPEPEVVRGQAILVEGQIVVPNKLVTKESVIVLCPFGKDNSGKLSLSVDPGVSFTITSTNLADSRPVNWGIV